MTLDDLLDSLADRVAERLAARLNGHTRDASPASPERWLTAAEVAEMLGTSVRWVYQHAAQLGGSHLSRRCVRFPESAVRRYLERRSR